MFIYDVIVIGNFMRDSNETNLTTGFPLINIDWT